MQIYHFSCTYPHMKKEGFLLHEAGHWSEVSPFPGRNQETLSDALAQLKNPTKDLFPSVAFGLYSLQAPIAGKFPVCLLLMGSADEIYKHAHQSIGYTTAKIKVGHLDPLVACHLVKDLKDRFRLRIDINEQWTPSQVLEFCSHFKPTDFDFIEDPGCDISPYPMKTEKTTVWKPMVRGIPPMASDVILSSVFETGVGICQIAALAQKKEIPPHPLGIGTYNYLADDILEEPLLIEDGYLHVPSKIHVKKERLVLC